MITLLLVRHATNDWVNKRLASWLPHVHLNEEGTQQAHQLAQTLHAMPIAAIYSSPLERAVETAHAIASHHAVPIHILEGIGEVHFGEWSGEEIATLKQQPLWHHVQQCPSSVHFPAGETLYNAQHRAVDALDTIRMHHDDTQHALVVAVTHGDIIKLVVAHYVGIHLDLFQRLVIHPASVTIIAFDDRMPQLLTLNYTGTLDHMVPTSPVA